MKITLERSKCIGCGSCAVVCPQFFEMADDTKAHLIGSQKGADEIETLDVEEAGCAKEAAEVCSVQIIKIE